MAKTLPDVENGVAAETPAADGQINELVDDAAAGAAAAEAAAYQRAQADYRPIAEGE